ncbi:MAG: Trm112 family protein [Candidatus Diapherotrites archaeon]|nr:Trm112 family protein [Candidatus Diapherotrites archaeon]
MQKLSKELLAILACPKCKGNLNYNKKENKLICKKCRLAYRIEDGIPIMLIEEAEKLN